MILLDTKIKAYFKTAISINNTPTNLKIGPPSHKLEEPIYFSRSIRMKLPNLDPSFWCQVHRVFRLDIEGRVEVIQILWLNIGPQLSWGVNVD